MSDLQPDHATLRVLVDQLTDAQVAHVLRGDHDLWDDAAFAAAGVLTTPEANRRLLIDRFEQAIAMGDERAELDRFVTLADGARAAHPVRLAHATFPLDPRVAPIIDALTDAQVAKLLQLAGDEWCPGEDSSLLMDSPAANRRLAIDAFILNIGMGGEAELGVLERLAAAVRLTHSTQE